MDTNSGKLLAKEEVFQIVGCAIEVLNTLGHGIVEKPYEKALVVEFGLRNILFRQQPPFDVLYKGHKVGLFIPDLIAFESVVVGYKGDRSNHQPRTWFDVELSSDHKATCRGHPEFHAREVGVGANRLMNW